ncbi:multicopper oxidase family protein [Thalassiella azotivora]
MTRRSVLRAGAWGAVAAGAGVTAGCSTHGSTGELLRSTRPLPAPFTLALTVPPVLAPTPATAPDVDTYRVEARVTEVEVLPGLRTEMLTYGGSFPGPTVEARRGRPVHVEHVNRLPVPMVVHLHGGVVPAGDDGFPTELVLPEPTAQRRHAPSAPGHAHGGDGHPPGGAGHVRDPLARVSTGRRVYRYPMDQPAATLWYHDHRMDFTGPMVYRGLAGFHLVRDDAEEALGLPRDEHELPLMVADRAFGDDAELLYPSLDPTLTRQPGVRDHAVEGVLGDVVLVNGTPWPVADVDAAAYRLRVLNASNARRYRLELDPPPPSGAAFTQVGSDGGLLAAPVGHSNLTLAPAERVDVVVDFSAYPVGTRVVLRNTLGEGGAGLVMRFDVVRRGRGAAAAGREVPSRLVDVERLRGEDAVATRAFRFTRGPVTARDGDGGHAPWTVNGRVFDPVRPEAVVRPGQVERWRLGGDLHHPVHVHLAAFQVVARGSGGPGPMDGGWKDTVDLRPAEHVDVLVRFPDLPGRYVMHCHNLEHEDMMMMATFEVRR